MKSQSRKKQCLILGKACARNDNGKASLEYLFWEDGGKRMGVQGYRLQTKTGRRQSHLLFFLSIYFGFFKAIIKKKLYNQYKKVAILEKSLKENIPLVLNFQNFC